MSTNEFHRRNNRVISVIQTTTARFALGSDVKTVIFWILQMAFACFAILLLTQIIALFMASGDAAKMFECFSVLSFCIMAAFKYKSMRTNYKKWAHLLIQLDSLECEVLNYEKPEIDYDSDNENTEKCCEAHVDSYTEKFRKLSLNVRRVYFFTLLIFILSPFIEYLYWELESEESVSYPHILPSWSPLDTCGFWGYLIAIVAELFASIYTVMVHFAFDIMFFGTIIFLTGQFELLRDLTKSLGGKGRGYDMTPQRDARAHFRIIKCHHILLILEKSVYNLDELVQQILGIYFLVAMLSLGSVAVTLSTEELSVMEVLSLLQYTMGCLTQLFLFCYYGDMLLHESSVGMAEGVYASAWWRLTPRLRREAMLLAVGQARVRRLRAGPFNRLDLPSFIQVVRAAYSYYAVIQK